MRRREFLAGLFGIGVIAPKRVRPQALFRTVIEVDSGDPAVMLRTLNIVLETGRYHIAHRESAEIRVIAVGEGLAMMRADTSPVLDRFKFVSRSVPLASWYVGAEDVAAATSATGEAPPLIEGVAIVQNGASEAEGLQATGWSLIRP